MLVTSPDRLGYVIDAVASSQPLTPEQLDAFKQERKKPEYEGMDDRAFAEDVSKPKTVAVSLPPIPRTEWKRDELYNVLLQMTLADGVTPFFLALDAMKENANPQVSALAKMVDKTLTGPLVAINLENPGVAQGLAGLRQAGLLSQAQYDFITTVPNPVTTEVVPSLVEQITGVVGVLTLEEAEATRS